jgi:hypothetical protein
VKPALPFTPAMVVSTVPADSVDFQTTEVPTQAFNVRCVRILGKTSSYEYFPGIKCSPEVVNTCKNLREQIRSMLAIKDPYLEHLSYFELHIHL